MLKKMLLPHITISYLFLVFGALFGLIYSLQLIGYAQDLIRPDIARSLHLSLMLYGFIPMMLSLLPFALFEKEGLRSEKGVYYLQRFFILWYIFLIFMMSSLLAGVTRGLPFYDFPYELNVLLAFAGLFYLLAILETIKGYTLRPLWVKVSLIVIIVSPFALLLLMNPDYGQVEQMLLGPHGDNTLGMSFALLVIYYLAIKLASPKSDFVPRWHMLWVIPLVSYLLSVLYRSFVGALSYEAEWGLQYLSLLYIPLIYRWWKDAGLGIRSDLTLFISIVAFLFVDVEGNILFIPGIRELFHRNDLVVGHAHIAVGIGLLFLAISIIRPFVMVSRMKALFLTLMIVLMAVVLSLSGLSQAGIGEIETLTMWQYRSLFGFLFLVGLLASSDYFSFLKDATPIGLYHLIAFMSDGIGGILLLFFGSYIYGLIGQEFTGGYQQIVFGFVAAIGIIHLIGFLSAAHAYAFATATVVARVLTSAGFFALYKAGVLGWIAVAIAAVDLAFALVYIVFFKDHEQYKGNR